MSSGPKGPQEVNAPAGISAPAFLVRSATAITYAAVVLGALWFGPHATAAVFGVMASMAAGELYAFTRREARPPNELLGIVAAASMPISAAVWGFAGLASVVTALGVASLVLHTSFVRLRAADTAVTVFGAIYVGFFLGHLVMIRSLESGLILSVAVIVSVWVADVFAFVIGSTLGRHRMAPRISPKKSWEGFAAGTIGAIAVWAAVPLVPGSGINWTQALLTGVAIALSSVVGDLFESRLKREAGVKDSGRSLPGHGGFLDRLDSLIVVSVVAYWVLWWSGVR